jgi:ADP-ribose pyrophosphatase YjhB (NUDIX family)
VHSKRWSDVWFTPGGRLEEWETVSQGFEHQAREKVGVEVAEPRLTRILPQNITAGSRVRYVYFAQFSAQVTSVEAHPGRDVLEVWWFDVLPADMAFREDYLPDSGRLLGLR